MIKDKLPSDWFKCDIQSDWLRLNAGSKLELQKSRWYQSRGIEILTSITLVQCVWYNGSMVDWSRPDNAQRNGGGMSISGRSKTWKKWSAANILKEELSQQSHEWTFATQKARWRQEMERYCQRRESKGDQWQSGGIDMIPTNQIASRVDRDPKNRCVESWTAQTQ